MRPEFKVENLSSMCKSVRDELLLLLSNSLSFNEQCVAALDNGDEFASACSTESALSAQAQNAISSIEHLAIYTRVAWRDRRSPVGRVLHEIWKVSHMGSYFHACVQTENA
jgi:hypothetical protein